MFKFLDLCVSSLRRGHANLLCIVPILTDDPRRESNNNGNNNSKLIVIMVIIVVITVSMKIIAIAQIITTMDNNS
jgi:hypothetical protein